MIMIKLKSLIREIFLSDITAHHGTPHKIDGEFKIEKIGTGEGAASFGWGLYFAGNIETAKSYYKSLAAFTIHGIPIRDYYQKQNFPRNVMHLARQMNSTIDVATGEWEKIHPKMLALDYLMTYGDEAEYMLRSSRNPTSDAAINLIKNWTQTGILKKSSNLYTVEIDVNPVDMLDWFELVDNQSKEIQQIATEFVEHGKPVTGEKLYRLIGEKTGGKRQASEYLHKRGIMGIKYEDRGSRGKDNGKTYNYVIFDPKLIRITTEKGVPISPEKAEKENSFLVTK